MCKLGKLKPWKVLKDNPESFKELSSLGTSLSVADCTLSSTETFFCRTFDSSRTNIDETRYDMFCRKFKKTEQLAPTKDSLVQHINRANYQTYVWKRALEPNAQVEDPVGHGWKKDDVSVVPLLLTKSCAPKSLLVVVSCGCVKSECRGRCSCQKTGLPCIESCSCSGGNDCKNPHKLSNEENESDEDSDDDNDEEDAL